jgi:hypothetical protein
MNYQYRYGGSTKNSIQKLYNDGGFKRYYHGLMPALIQGPIARFGDTFANVGILALLASNPLLNKLPSPLKTVFASVAGALFRMILVPIDTVKVRGIFLVLCQSDSLLTRILFYRPLCRRKASMAWAS